MKDEERKEEMVRRIVESRYPDFYKIESDEEFSISDLDDYRRFCDHSILNDKASWKKFTEIIHKVRTKGVGSILFNKEVKEVWKAKIDFERESIDGIYISLDKMPTFAVAKDGTIHKYV